VYDREELVYPYKALIDPDLILYRPLKPVVDKLRFGVVNFTVLEMNRHHNLK